MGRKPKSDQVKQLIDIGKEKGFLTYDQVNDVLPPDMVSPDQIDELMLMFGEMDIEGKKLFSETVDALQEAMNLMGNLINCHHSGYCECKDEGIKFAKDLDSRFG